MHGMMKTSSLAIMLAITAIFAVEAANANETESWSFDLTTNGQDVFWTSPTAVADDAPQYEGSYEITLIEVTGTWIGIPVGPVDVTNDVPKEDLSGTQVLDGPPPIVLLNDALVYPEPPADPSVAANVLIYLDENGFGQIDITDVFLGTAEVDTDFGTVNVQITSIRVVGTMDITPLGPPGDVNGDRVVNVDDLLIVLNAWGTCTDCNECPADVNGDCAVNVDDLLIVLNNWG